MFNLLEKLKSHKPFDEKEKISTQKTIEFLKSDTNCFSRTNLKAHITAGALVCNTNGKILLNHHKLANMWMQFGGHSDGNENSFEVALREVQEESGIKNFVNLSDEIFDVNHEVIENRPHKNEPEHIHFDINFLFVTENENFVVSDESKSIKWVFLSEAKKLVSPNDHGMIRMLKKYEQLLNKNAK